MRRLWAYIVTAFTALVLIGTTFTSIFVNATSNIEYQDGREIVFRISDENNENPEAFEKGEAVKEIASVMEERLALQGISRYSVATEGIDTVKVTFSANNNDEYEKVKLLLSFNGSLALTTSNDDVALGSEFLTDKKAYLDDVNGYPTVVIPVDTDNAQFQTVVEAVKKQQEDFDSNATTNEDGTTSSETAYLYLWCDYVEDYDSFIKTQQNLEDGSTNPEYDENVAKKIVMTFSANDLYYPDDEENKLAAGINLDADGNGSLTVTEVTKGYNNARYYVNLINASELDYHVEFMYSKTVSAWYENLVGYGMHEYVNWSATFVAFIVAIAILSALLATFYRLSAVSGIVTTLGTVFAGIAFIVLFGAEFNTAAIIGLALAATASLVSSVLYFNKLKEEAYKGRSLKKANTEAAKKSLLPTVDVNVVVIVIGAVMYLLGPVLFKAFAAATVLGGLVSLILNTTLLRGMMWLATNTTGLTGKYSVFGIEEDKVPNLVNEEKQSYFGPYADKDFTKKHKPVGIIGLVLLVASIAGGIVFGAINKGAIYNDGGVKTENTQIYFETSAKNSELSETYIENLLENVYIHAEDTTESREAAKKLGDYVTTIDSYENVLVEDKTQVTYYYYVVTLNKPISSESFAYYVEGTTKTNSELISDTLSSIIVEDDSKATADVKEVKVVSQDQPEIAPIALATGVAALVLGLYFCLRYRLSRGIAATVLAIGSGVIAIGIFVLARFIVVPTYISVALPFIAAVSFILSTFVLNKERELLSESKDKTNTLEVRYDLLKKATAQAFSPLLISVVLVVYLGINFFGFGVAQTSLVYFVSIIGTALAALATSSLLAPFAHSIFSGLRKLGTNKTPKAPKKAKKVQRKKSAEPEEAIFIGIND